MNGLSLNHLRINALAFRVHYSAHPQRDSEWVKLNQPKYSKTKWDREQEIIHEAGGGERIFAEVFSRWEEKILIDPGRGFQAPPQWVRVAGFDYGKANPTAALVGCVDGDGILYILGEYYQPGLSPKQHAPFLRELRGFTDSRIVWADPSIFYQSQAQSDGDFKAINELYREEGITNLVEALDNAEEAGIERILQHWLDLENREPTLKIVCPRRLRNIEKPIYGVHNEGCPNLLWELRRARRAETSAGKLVNSNPSEQIVDKDNHLRDCLKYMVFAFTEPAPKTTQEIYTEALKDIPLDDATSRMIRGPDALLIAQKAEEAPMIPIGRRGQYNLMRYQENLRRRNGMWMRNLFRDPGERG